MQKRLIMETVQMVGALPPCVYTWVYRCCAYSLLHTNYCVLFINVVRIRVSWLVI